MLYLEEVHPEFRMRLDSDIETSSFSRRLRNVETVRKSFFNYAKIEDEADTEVEEEQEALNGSLHPEEIGEVIWENSIALASRGTRPGGQDSTSPELTQAAPPSRYSFQVILQILSVSRLAFHKVSSYASIPIFSRHLVRELAAPRL